MNCTPSLHTSNRFSVLSVDEIKESVETIQVVQNLESSEQNRVFRPQWERKLPGKLVIASVEDKQSSLNLKVTIETTDTGEVKSLSSLVD